MPRKRLPSYRRHKASGQAIVTLNGRDFYLGPHGSTASRTEYDRLIGEWLANGRRPLESAPQSDLRICELLSNYREFAAEYYSRDGETTQEYRSVCDVIKPLLARYSRTRALDFGPLAFKALREEMVERGLARKHINQRMNRIRRIFKWAVENELVPPAVLQGLQAVAPLKRGRTSARETSPVAPPPEKDVAAVLPLVSRQVAAMIQLQRLSGMRPGEIVRLRPCEVEQQGEVWIYRPPRHKTDYLGHIREIYFGPRAQEVLKPFLERDSEAYCFSPKEAEEERNRQRRANRQSPMTPSQARRTPKKRPKRAKRDHYDRDSYRRAIYYAADKAGVPRWSPHQLRHECGTKIRKQYGLEEAQLILGQRDANVTQIYAERDQGLAMKVASQSG